MNDLLAMGALVLLLLINAFFVAAEFAAVSAKQEQVEALNHRNVPKALQAMRSLNEVLAACQLGIMFCSLLILLVSEPAIHHFLTSLIADALPADAVAIISFAAALLAVSLLHVIIGEIVPKNIAFAAADRTILLLAGPILYFAKAVHPITWVMNWLARGVMRLLKIAPRSEMRSAYSIEQVGSIIEISAKEGSFTDRSGSVQAAVSWGKTQVREMKKPLQEVVSVTAAATAAELENLVSERGYLRYLVYDTDSALDSSAETGGFGGGEPIGYVHLKDLITLDEQTANLPLPADKIRPLISVYDGASLESTLAVMQRNRAHIALTFSGGAISGVIFLQDIVDKLICGKEGIFVRKA